MSVASGVRVRCMFRRCVFADSTSGHPCVWWSPDGTMYRCAYSVVEPSYSQERGRESRCASKP